jgi:hypothetical protein
MGIAPADLEKAALDMAPELRAKLAGVLIQSLDEVGEVDEAEVERMWLEEASTRSRQIDAGEVEPLPAEDVLRDLRSRRR